MGNNHWAIAAEGIEEYANKEGYPVRNLEPLRNKFDKFCNSKKPTRFSDYPPAVWRVIQIACDIHFKPPACILGGTGEDKKNRAGDLQTRDPVETETCFGSIGASEERKRASAGSLKGTPKNSRQNADLLEYVENMTSHRGCEVKNNGRDNKTSSCGVTEEDVLEIVNSQARDTHDMSARISIAGEKRGRQRE